jgi:hypothetical protein
MMDTVENMQKREKEKVDRVEQKEVLQDAIVDSPTTQTQHRQRLRLGRSHRRQR